MRSRFDPRFSHYSDTVDAFMHAIGHLVMSDLEKWIEQLIFYRRNL